MRKIIVMAVCCALAAPIWAGEIYGSISEGNGKVGEGVAVEARCGDKAYPAVKTDKNGAYQLDVAQTGKCTLTVKFKDQAPSVEVVAYEEGAQVDLVLELKDGKYNLRRK